jgi:thioredoxin 1
MEIILTKTNFEKEVLNSGKKVLIDFWAPWCGPCRMLSPIIEDIAKNAPEGVVVGKINVDEQPELAAKYGIMSIPTVMVFDKGEPVKKSIGVKPKQQILELLK